jgi:hypothetical protein
MKPKFVINAQDWKDEATRAQREVSIAITASMRTVGKKAADAANAVIHGAGFANRKWEIKAKNFPEQGDSLSPEVWLHSSANFEDVFTEGAFIHGNPLLWLPLPSVPLWPGDSTRQMSPKKYVETIGPLVTMRRKGKPPMLGAPVTGSLRPQPFGRFVTKARLKKGRTGQGPVTIVPLFVGVPGAFIEKRFDVEAIVDKIADQLPEIYVQNENR